MNLEEELLFALFIIIFLVYCYGKLGGFRGFWGLFLSKSKQNELNSFFSKYFNYFNQLNVKEKKRFILRANSIANSTRFVGMQNFTITERVKLFVVAAQVQLTFGFRNYSFSKFKTVIIYPNSYKSPSTGKMHYGEVSTKGVISLSWQRLVRGHLIPDDKINLGLHELAHALMYTIIHRQNHDLGLDVYLKDFLKLSKPEISKIRNSDNHFFREYAGSNAFEFFAVAIEHFFEVPQDFKKELPQLYQYIVKLLKQDPTS